MSALDTAAALLAEGDQVSARVYVPQFGELRVGGRVRLRANGRTLSVSGYPLVVDGVPAKNVLCLTIVEVPS